MNTDTKSGDTGEEPDKMYLLKKMQNKNNNSNLKRLKVIFLNYY